MDRPSVPPPRNCPHPATGANERAGAWYERALMPGKSTLGGSYGAGSFSRKSSATSRGLCIRLDPRWPLGLVWITSLSLALFRACLGLAPFAGLCHPCRPWACLPACPPASASEKEMGFFRRSRSLQCGCPVGPPPPSLPTPPNSAWRHIISRCRTSMGRDELGMALCSSVCLVWFCLVRCDGRGGQASRRCAAPRLAAEARRWKDAMRHGRPGPAGPPRGQLPSWTGLHWTGLADRCGGNPLDVLHHPPIIHPSMHHLWAGHLAGEASQEGITVPTTRPSVSWASRLPHTLCLDWLALLSSRPPAQSPLQSSISPLG